MVNHTSRGEIFLSFITPENAIFDGSIKIAFSKDKHGKLVRARVKRSEKYGDSVITDFCTQEQADRIVNDNLSLAEAKKKFLFDYTDGSQIFPAFAALCKKSIELGVKLDTYMSIRNLLDNEKLKERYMTDEQVAKYVLKTGCKVLLKFKNAVGYRGSLGVPIIAFIPQPLEIKTGGKESESI